VFTARWQEEVVDSEEAPPRKEKSSRRVSESSSAASSWGVFAVVGRHGRCSTTVQMSVTEIASVTTVGESSHRD
jgi:hypothetical protein